MNKEQAQSINKMVEDIHEANKQAGWYTNLDN